MSAAGSALAFLLLPKGAGRRTRRKPIKAVVYKGPFKLAIENVEDPKIEQPGDAVIRVTTANICGSDLHPYERRAPLEAGMVTTTAPKWPG